MKVKKYIHTALYMSFAISAGCFIFASAYANRTTFPFPWNDEARFYLAAFWWAEHFSLSPTNLHAPVGIFWVPDGFTIFLGLALRLCGETMQVARATCECTVSLGVILFACGFRKLAGSYKGGALATLLLLTPPVIFAANMVRMEAPLFLLLSLVLLLHVQERFLAAGSLLAGSLLFHPALAVAAVGYIVIACVTPSKRRSRCDFAAVAEWIIFAGVVMCISAESLRIFSHLELFRTHMAYQLQHKMSSSLHSKLIKPQGVILLMSCFAVAAVFWRQLRRPEGGTVWNVLSMAAITLGTLLYAVVGGEMSYDAYSLSIGPALTFCLIYRDIHERSVCCSV